MADYPKREPFFAHKAVRLMIRVCAAQDIGSDAFALITVIAHTEDAKRYSGPVTWWNDQLAPVLGFSSWGKLDRARKRAVAAGWLHYEPGGRGKVGKYWVTIPEGLNGIPDGAVDEDHPAIVSTAGEDNVRIPPTSSPLVEKKPREKWRGSGDPSSLSPSPNPKDALAPDGAPPPPARETKKTKPFVKPTLEDVRTLCRTKQNGVDPEAFWHHHEARGWILSNGRQMKNWRSAIVTWEKNQARFGDRAEDDAPTNYAN